MKHIKELSFLKFKYLKTGKRGNKIIKNRYFYLLVFSLGTKNNTFTNTTVFGSEERESESVVV